MKKRLISHKLREIRIKNRALPVANGDGTVMICNGRESALNRVLDGSIYPG